MNYIQEENNFHIEEKKIGFLANSKIIAIEIVKFVIFFYSYAFYINTIILLFFLSYYGLFVGFTGDSGESALGFVGLIFAIPGALVLSILTIIFYQRIKVYWKKIFSFLLILLVTGVICFVTSHYYQANKRTKLNNAVEISFNDDADFVDLTYIGSENFKIDESTKLLYFLDKNDINYRINEISPIDLSTYNFELKKFELFEIKEGAILVNPYISHDSYVESYFIPNVFNKEKFYEININYTKLTEKSNKKIMQSFTEDYGDVTEYVFNDTKYLLSERYGVLELYKNYNSTLYILEEEIDYNEIVRKVYPDATKYVYCKDYIEITNNYKILKVKAVLLDDLSIELKQF